jgi:prepilin-type N-terminal cleavage/methylation domain-containing protein
VLILARRRGFTLAETILAMVLLLMVSGSVYRMLLSTVRLARSQAEHIALQSNVRGAAVVVGNELRELSTAAEGGGAANDLLSLAPAAISYRAMRGFGYTCQTPGPGLLRISRSAFFAYRDPQPGRDSALLYLSGRPTPADSGWVATAISAVTGLTTCGAGEPAISLTLPAAIGSIPVGTPVRIYEPMELAAYQSDGQWWLGMRSLSSGEAIQPVFGPLAATDGFRLVYSDAAQVATAIPGLVKSITVTIRGSGTDYNNSPAGPLTEALTTQITLKNAQY